MGTDAICAASLAIAYNEDVSTAINQSRHPRLHPRRSPLTALAHGPRSFATPASHSTRNPLWRWPEVDAWFATYEGRAADTERAVIVSAINGALQARHRLTETNEPAALRKALKALLAS
jgi:hypothetical protein